jgi:hypothetical protein
MLERSLPAPEALKTTKENEFARWKGTPEAAQLRIAQKVCVPMGRQSFRSGQDTTFFAMGSCFARNVEEQLEDAGAVVLSRKVNIPDLGDDGARLTGVFNKYNPFSILQELQFASGEREFTENALLPDGSGQYYDAQLRVKSGNGTADELMSRREQLAGYFRQSFEADVFILTLGLIESWYDNETNLFLTEPPAPRLILNNPDRFSFKCLSTTDVKYALSEIHRILKNHSKKGQKVVMTVSPVPIGRTFTKDDIIVANMTSKSTLRTALLEFLTNKSDIDYFPSYEAVMYSHPDLSWQSDRLHVSDFIVGKVIRVFLERYGIKEGEPQETKLTETPEQKLIRQLNLELNRYKNRLVKEESNNMRRANSPE